jgi:hypothetical protein
LPAPVPVLRRASDSPHAFTTAERLLAQHDSTGTLATVAGVVSRLHDVCDVVVSQAAPSSDCSNRGKHDGLNDARAYLMMALIHCLPCRQHRRDQWMLHNNSVLEHVARGYLYVSIPISREYVKSISSTTLP